jgi:hypothetical protein
MAAKLRANLPSDELRVTVGDFERVDVPDRSMGAVFSATGYHWLTPPRSLIVLQQSSSSAASWRSSI